MAVVNIRHRLPPFEQGFACRVEQSSPVGSGAGVSVEALGCQVWWRGFLANRAALILQLGRGGASCSDEELVALAYRRWGVGVQAHLIGEYASVVLDRAADVLLLTHDALGVVPLYYSARGQTIYFGTHLSALAAMMPDVGLDESYIAEFLLRGQCLGERTIYRGVRRLGMGRTLRYRVGGGASEHRTWWLGEVAELRYRDSRDYDDHFRELVHRRWPPRPKAVLGRSCLAAWTRRLSRARPAISGSTICKPCRLFIRRRRQRTNFPGSGLSARRPGLAVT